MKVNTYQLTVVINPKTEDKEKTIEKVVGWVEDVGGKVTKKDHFGLKDLVYEIKKLRKGDFWILTVESEKAIQLKELSLFLNREISIIRYLVLKK